MTEQKKLVMDSVNYIKSKDPFKGKVEKAVVSYNGSSFVNCLKIVSKIKYENIPPSVNEGVREHEGNFIFAKAGKTNFYFLDGHINYFEEQDIRLAAHPIYVLKELGVKKVLLIDEVGHLNPGYHVGGVSLIFDHINLMGVNPLIGENDSSLGIRFPDMSNAYDRKLYGKVENYFIEKKLKYFPSVYIGVSGPETETEAECRFYREIGSDVLGYSLVPETLAAVHAGIRVAALGMISRELVADRLLEISREDKLKNREKAEKYISPAIKDIIQLL